ncbi:hypothetical protein [Senegalimassilia faecalis]|uniref:hypothetical protein n=1 Tax=Senegalimassilia faecalis TaxID=2509433 RepID=UPI003A96B9C5
MAEEMMQGNLRKVPVSLWSKLNSIKEERKLTYPGTLATLIEDHERADVAKAACDNPETAADRNAAAVELARVQSIIDALCVKFGDAAAAARYEVEDEIKRTEATTTAWMKKAEELAGRVDELAPKAHQADEAIERARVADEAKKESERKAENAVREAESAKEQACDQIVVARAEASESHKAEANAIAEAKAAGEKLAEAEARMADADRRAELAELRATSAEAAAAKAEAAAAKAEARVEKIEGQMSAERARAAVAAEKALEHLESARVANE